MFHFLLLPTQIFQVILHLLYLQALDLTVKLYTNGSGVLSFATISETKPTVADVSQTIAPSSATTINITGTNFVAIPIVDFINASTGAVTRANTVSLTSATQLSVNLTLASGNYFVRIENPDGLAGRSTNNIITASTAPSFSTLQDL